MLKIDDRSEPVRRRYAESRLEAALLLRPELDTNEAIAQSADTATVSLARLRSWDRARAEAKYAWESAPTLKRRLRRSLLAVPMARWFVYSGRLMTSDLLAQSSLRIRTTRQATSRRLGLWQLIGRGRARQARG
jgi:hypothetical protein